MQLNQSVMKFDEHCGRSWWLNFDGGEHKLGSVAGCGSQQFIALSVWGFEGGGVWGGGILFSIFVHKSFTNVWLNCDVCFWIVSPWVSFFPSRTCLVFFRSCVIVGQNVFSC